ncbi:Protein CBG02406 [Caenorhabditis briggsae]|uniref:Protein CBG02406 n=1 Tax=Caenorhabditis briggsae TaxID=6238 RepID=A8WUE2_CAEBR|nr:Protein CBG02406 [Caenorhabditis briggsae]CAP24104.2 Protein CBG02406 [Caenorhabditis briggsae]
MLKLENENVLLHQEIKVLKLKLSRVQNNRDQLETELSIIRAENDELKTIVYTLEKRLTQETPILSPQIDTPVSENSFENGSIKSYGKKEQEPEFFSETGPDFDSKWYKNICIAKSHPNYIVLRNCSQVEVNLYFFIFSIIVTFHSINPWMTLFSSELSMVRKRYLAVPSQKASLFLRNLNLRFSCFYIYSDHPGARNVYGKSCILHRYNTFGSGKVTENIILDETGKETANYILCVFQE